MKFSEMNLDKELVRITEELGFASATLIQEKTIPLLKEGKDVIAQSETGSGKTLAFAFPILEKIKNGGGLQCLVITPTRELAEQVGSDFFKFSKYKKARICAVYGGVSIEPQISALRTSEVVVATPGRMLDHISRRTVDLSKIGFLVLDEADKMFEMGFIDDVRAIISALPKDRQTLLFSATISKEIQDLSARHMRNPVSVKAKIYVEKSLLGQSYFDVPMREKFSLLLHLINEESPGLGMIFCGTRDKTDVVAKNLKIQGIDAVPIHGGHSQNKRNSIIKSFHVGKIHILVATDVAARGLDIKNVTHVFNFDIPKTSQEYIHRIGRTARAGKTGKAISLLSENDYENFQRVLDDRSLMIERKNLPEFRRVPFIIQRRSGGPARRTYASPRQQGGYRSQGPRYGRGRR